MGINEQWLKPAYFPTTTDSWTFLESYAVDTHGGQRGGDADRPLHRLCSDGTRQDPPVLAAGGALARHNYQVAPNLYDARRSASSRIQVPPGTAGCWEVFGAGHALGRGTAKVLTEKGRALHQLADLRWTTHPGAGDPSTTMRAYVA